MKIFKSLVLATALASMSAASLGQTPESVDLDDIVVTGTRTEQNAQNATVKPEVITSAQIEALAAGDLGEVLESALGTLLEPNGYSHGTIRLQGLDGRHALILIDGQRQIQAAHGSGGVDVSHISIESIERIEIARGAGSALYGSDALSGVVNIITKKAPPSGDIVSLSASFGSDKGRRHSLYNSGRGSENLSWTLSAKADEGIRWDDTDQFQKSHGVDFGVNYRFAPKYSSLWRYRENKEAQPSLDDRQERNNQFVFGVSGNPDSASKFDMSVSKSGYNRSTNDPSRAKNSMGQVQANYSRKLNDTHQIATGMEYYKDSYRSDTIDMVSHIIRGVYIQDEIMLTAVTLALGARVDSHPAFGSQTSPKASALWRATEDMSVRASYGEAFRAPDPASIYRSPSYLVMGPSQFYLAGNKGLQPETNTNYQAGVDWTPGDRLNIGLSYFRNDAENLIATAVNGTYDDGTHGVKQLRTYLNVGGVETSGFEFEAKGKPSANVSLRLAYTHTKSEVVKDSNAALIGKKRAKTPESKAVFSAGWTPGAFSLNATAKYFGSSFYDVNNAYAIPSHTVVDMKISRRFGKNLAAFISANNVFDEQNEYVYTAAGLKTSGVEPASYLIGLTWEL